MNIYILKTAMLFMMMFVMCWVGYTNVVRGFTFNQNDLYSFLIVFSVICFLLINNILKIKNKNFKKSVVNEIEVLIYFNIVTFSAAFLGLVPISRSSGTIGDGIVRIFYWIILFLVSILIFFTNLTVRYLKKDDNE